MALRRTLTAALAALLLTVAALGSLQGTAGALSGAEEGLRDGMNAARSSHGLVALASDGDLVRVARAWSARMVSDYESSGSASGALRHNPNVFDEIPQDYRKAAENVGYRSSGSSAALADRFLDGFMSSSGHRENILGPFTRVGVGMARASDGTVYATVVFSDGDPPSKPPPDDDEGEDEGEEEKGEQETKEEESAPPPRSERSSSSRGEDSEPEPDPEPEAEAGGTADGDSRAAEEPEAEAVEEPAPLDLPTGEELFGDGWPEGYLLAGAWAPPIELLAPIAGARTVLISLGSSAPSEPPGLLLAD